MRPRFYRLACTGKASAPYQYWRLPDGRPYAAWLPAGQIATTVGLTVLAAAGMAMWGLLADFGLVEYGDELAIFATN